MAQRKKIEVLIVDDSAVVRATLTDMLSSDPDIEVMATAQDPYVAVKRMKTRLPDVITLDVEMPRMDGLHLTAKVRNDQFLKDLPVLIFSSLASEDNKLKWRDLGANEIVTKPDLPNLVKLADSLIR